MPAVDEREISLDNWRNHKVDVKKAGLGEHAEVFLFHAHSYGDATNPVEKETLETW